MRTCGSYIAAGAFFVTLAHLGFSIVYWLYLFVTTRTLYFTFPPTRIGTWNAHIFALEGAVLAVSFLMLVCAGLLRRALQDR